MKRAVQFVDSMSLPLDVQIARKRVEMRNLRQSRERLNNFFEQASVEQIAQDLRGKQHIDLLLP